MRPVTALDVATRGYAVSVLGGQGRGVDGITAAQPPTGSATRAARRTGHPAADPGREGRARSCSPAGSDPGMGSNAVAFGGDTTANGRGLLLGNPHYPWQGGRRFWQSQQTIPGELNVSGASLLGTPTISIGFNAQGGVEPHRRDRRPAQPAPADAGSGRPDGVPGGRQAGADDEADRDRRRSRTARR